MTGEREAEVVREELDQARHVDRGALADRRRTLTSGADTSEPGQEGNGSAAATIRDGQRTAAELQAAGGRATSFWHYFRCVDCDWSRSVQINAKPSTIRRGFYEIGEHVASHRIAAITEPVR